ncbi:MAG: class I SAM-dependent methyltransferase [Pseudomonadota bacterium]
MQDYRNTVLLALPQPPKRALMLNAAPLPGDALRDVLTCEQGFRPDYLALDRAGYTVAPHVDEAGFDTAFVPLHRARAVNEANIARAHNAVAEGGSVIVAGPVKSSIKALRKWVAARTPVEATVSKHHAVAFRFTRSGVDWPLPDLALDTDGYITQAGTFSADRVDAGSRLLVRHFGPALRGCVADFGAGWGYLSAELLKVAPDVGNMVLYEADHVALDCARKNMSAWPDIAHFHWMDVAHEFERERFNHVIMNPPFHTARAAEPELGQAFIAAAGRALMPGGSLLMVANRNLPYEVALSKHFKRWEQVADEQGFKVVEAFV